MSENKVYLGDSVYADVKGSMIVLTTDNGLPIDPSNTIYLDSDVIWALREFLTKHGF